MIYRGLLDLVLSQDGRATPSSSAHPSPLLITPSSPPRRSLLSLFFGGSSPSSPPSPSTASSPSRPCPTDTQTLHLATILSHELAHLLLSHHLESLSHTSVVLPSMVNLGGDLVRTLLFPLTVGPFSHSFFFLTT